MSRASRATSPGPRRSAAKQPWRQHCGNKREKKQLLSTSGGRRGRKRRQPKRGVIKLSSPDGEAAGMLSIGDCLSGLSDPRVNRRRLHRLADIVVIAMCAVIAEADTWKDIRLWAESNERWLRRFLELPNGIPSRDTFRRVISRLNATEFQACFCRWVKHLSRSSDGRIVAIDGKTARRSMIGDERKPLHLVSAWASEQHLTLGQVAVDEKSNEITAIPELLKLIDVQGALVTIDAMGCQKEIARQIIDQGGNFCLAAKGNQPHLQEDLIDHFNACFEDDFSSPDCDYYCVESKGHGRQESRHYYTTPVPASLRNRDEWAGIQSVGLAITYRNPGEEGEVRRFIMSVPSDAKTLARATRMHWGIENSLHWVLDVTINEDQSRIREDDGTQNFAWLRRIAITLLKHEPTVNDTIRAKRKRAAYNIDYLEAVLLAAASPN